MSRILTSRYDPTPLIKAQEDDPKKNNSWLSRESGLSRPSIIAVMAGQTSNLDLIEPVCRLLGVPVSQLFERAAGA